MSMTVAILLGTGILLLIMWAGSKAKQWRALKGVTLLNFPNWVLCRMRGHTIRKGAYKAINLREEESLRVTICEECGAYLGYASHIRRRLGDSLPGPLEVATHKLVMTIISNIKKFPERWSAGRSGSARFFIDDRSGLELNVRPFCGLHDTMLIDDIEFHQATYLGELLLDAYMEWDISFSQKVKKAAEQRKEVREAKTLNKLTRLLVAGRRPLPKPAKKKLKKKPQRKPNNGYLTRR